MVRMNTALRAKYELLFGYATGPIAWIGHRARPAWASSSLSRVTNGASQCSAAARYAAS